VLRAQEWPAHDYCDHPPSLKPRMSSEANRIVQKLWSYCTVLRDDGLSYGDNLQALSGAERGAPVGAVLQP